jgi:ubiquinone/menaquinone biosynthesis C-methylase UbiE
MGVGPGLEKKTRKVFHEIHVVQGDDSRIYRRLRRLLSPAYLGVPKNYFAGKVCLDAGCGSNANATYSMLDHGAERVYAFDLDETVLKSAPKYLQRFKGRYELSVGTVLDLHYQDGFFDFVHCAGVLHHARDVYRGLGELARVTKPGGLLVFSVYGKGGLAREITSLLREKYAREEGFRQLIDNLTERQIQAGVQWILSEMTRQGDQWGRKVPMRLVKQLLDTDLVLTIKDRIKAPVYHEDSEEELVGWLKDHRFTHIQRLTRYPRYRNVRRFLSPLYYAYDHQLARLFYGSGFVQLKAIKEAKG